MDRRESEALDRYITGNYGEDQFDGDFEAETERLLNLRDKAIKSGIEFQIRDIETKLTEHCPDWREWVD